MECVQRAYVSFEFSPAFISESENNETFLGEDGNNPILQPGTLDRVLEQYKEVEIVNWDLNRLKVPKGALRFYFYYRMTATLCGIEDVLPTIEMRSDPIGESAWYYLEIEGELITREGLARGEGFHPVHPERRDSLLRKMDENDCDRIFQVSANWYEDGDLPLEPDDVVVKPNQVQMVDTEILWPND